MKKYFWFLIALILAMYDITAAPTDYSKDTVWTKKTDVLDGFYMVKFSNNDSLIVGHGYQNDMFYDAKTGKEINRIPFNAEVHFINNDKNFIRLAPSRNKLEIFDTKTFQVIDSLEHDSLAIGSLVITKDESILVAVISGGLRTWDLKTKKILKTKIFPTPTDSGLISWGFGRILLNNNNQSLITSIGKKIKNPDPKGQPIDIGSIILFDIMKFDSVGDLPSIGDFNISTTCKYIAYKTKDATYGVEVYVFNTKQLIQKLPINGPSITGIEFSSDDKYLVTSPTIKLWNMGAGKEDYSYQSGSANNISISHDGGFIFSTIQRYIYKWYARWGGVSVRGEENPTISIIFPNPSTGTASIQFNQPFSEATNINISNINGLIIKQISSGIVEAGNQIIPFNTSELTSGTYLIKVQNAHLSLIFKLIVNN